jgi:hypothetical protein
VREGDSVSLSNEAMSATWTTQNGSLRLQSLTNNFTGAVLPIDASAFELVPTEGSVLPSSDFRIVSGPAVEEIAACFEGSRLLVGQARSG